MDHILPLWVAINIHEHFKQGLGLYKVSNELKGFLFYLNGGDVVGEFFGQLVNQNLSLGNKDVKGNQFLDCHSARNKSLSLQYNVGTALFKNILEAP